MTPSCELTVVVATRNRAHLLPTCLDALGRQRTGARFEILVVDNGSADDTAAVVRERARGDDRIRLVQEPAVGLSNAKNAGIAAARGELLLFTDDDVVLPAGWLAAYADFFAATRHERPVLAGGPVLPVAHDLGPWPPWISDAGVADLPRLYHGTARRRLGAFDWLWGANMAAHRDLFERIGGFDVLLGVSGDRRGTFEDVELVERVAARGGECWYLPDAVVLHRTAQAATRPRALAGKAFSRGANDVLRARRGSHYEPALRVPRGAAAGAAATPVALGAWIASATAFRATRNPRAFELARRAAWATGWCTATATSRSDGRLSRTWGRAAMAGRRLAVRVTPR